MDPIRLTSKIVVFDVGGRVPVELPWNAGSELAKVTGALATLPNASAIDKQGNLYLADTGLAGATLAPKLEARPGVVMIPNGRSITRLRPAASCEPAVHRDTRRAGRHRDLSDRRHHPREHRGGGREASRCRPKAACGG